MESHLPIATPPEPMLVFRPDEATARQMREEELTYRRRMRRLASWLTGLTGLFGGLCALAAVMGWWDMAIPFGMTSVLLVLESRTTRRGSPGSEGRYHSAHAVECTLRVRQEHEAQDRAYIAKYGPVADAPPEHAEEYTMLALQIGYCIRYREQLENRLAQLRGEDRPAG